MINSDTHSQEVDIPHLMSVATTTPSPAFTGVWSTVELQPDIFVPQRFTVGVIVQRPGERLHFKLLDDIKKFDCIYQHRFPQRSLRELLAFAERTLRAAVKDVTPVAEIAFQTNSLFVTPHQFTSGDEIEATVERLYAELLVMAASPQKNTRVFESIDTLQARSLVNRELKRIAQMDYERIVAPSENGIFIDDKGVNHFLDLNLQTQIGCGSVISAVYKTTQTIELNLLKSSRDLTTYARIKKIESVGLFILLPDSDLLDAKDRSRIDATLREHEWKLERDGFRVVSFDTAARLAEEIYEWAKPSLA